MAVIDITWKWGTDTKLPFNTKDDVLNFGWFQGNQFEVKQEGNNVVISIPSDEEKYTLVGISLDQLTMANIQAKDASATAKWQEILGGDPTPPSPDPVPPTPPAPDPDPVPPGPAPDPDPVPPGPAPDPTGKLYSPYIDMGLWVGRTFPDLMNQANVNGITLAFIVGSNGTMKWGGCGESIGFFAPQIKQAQDAGKTVTISFGGANDPDPAVAYNDVSALVADLQKVIDLNNCYRLDFDIEGAASADMNAAQRRGAALSQLKRKNPKLFVSYTLAATREGIGYEGLANLRQAKVSYGFAPDVVNIMAMDYYTNETQMGQAAIAAAISTKRQLESIGLNDTKVGITPMVGVNDSHVEIFTLANAKEVLEFAQKTDYIASIGIWSITRDNGHPPLGEPRFDCSGIECADFAFSHIFEQL